MIMSVTKFRHNIYKMLDHIIETGIPLELQRKGKTIKITCEEKPSKFDDLKKHAIINGNPEELVEISWEQEWQNEHI